MIFFLRKYVPEYKKRRHLDTDGHKNYWMRKDVAFFYFTQLFFNIFCRIFYVFISKRTFFVTNSITPAAVSHLMPAMSAPAGA